MKEYIVEKCKAIIEEVSLYMRKEVVHDCTAEEIEEFINEVLEKHNFKTRVNVTADGFVLSDDRDDERIEFIRYPNDAALITATMTEEKYRVIEDNE